MNSQNTTPEGSGAPVEVEGKEKLRAIWTEILRKRSVSDEMNWLIEGGNSIRSMKLIGGIREAFQVQLSFSDIMHHHTIDGQWVLIRQRMAMQGIPVMRPAPFSASFPLSEIQKAIYLLESVRQGEGIYNVYALLHCSGESQPEAWQYALTQLVGRHESLRTFIGSTDEGELMQHVRDPRECAPEVQTAIAAGYEAAMALAELHIGRQIDIRNEAPVDLLLIQYAPGRSLLLLRLHHQVADGASLGWLINELYASYNAFITGLPAEPEPPSLHYRDYVMWEQQLIADPSFGLLKKFWHDQLAGKPAAFELPFAAPRPSWLPSNGKTLTFEPGEILSDKLSGLAARVGVGPFTIFFAAVGLLLYKVTKEADVIIGMPVSLRTQRETGAMIGPLINTLPVRIDLRTEERLDQFLQRLHQRLVLCRDHADYPLQAIVNDLGLSAHANRSPLFDVVVNYQPGDMLIQKNGLAGDLTVELLVPENIPVKYDLAINLFEFPEGVSGYLEYNTTLFGREAMENWMSLLKELIGRMTLRLDERTDDLLASIEEPEWLRSEPTAPATGAHMHSRLIREGTLATPTEMRLAQIWKEVLYTENPRREDDFFRAGGNSIKATKLAMAVHRQMKKKIDIRAIFLKPALWEIAAAIDEASITEYGGILPVKRDGNAVLSSAQRRIWVLSQWSKQDALFNIAGAWHVKQPVNKEKLKKVIGALISRHEILRTSFRLDGDEPVQCIHASVYPLPVSYFSYADESLRQPAEELFMQEGQLPFNLEKAPLFRLLVMEERPEEFYLCIIIHHIIADGWSIMNMAEEFVRDYCFSENGAGSGHPADAIQYRDYVAWQKAFLENDQVMQPLHDWWIAKLTPLPPVVDLPADRPRPPIRQFAGNTISRSLSRETINLVNNYTTGQEVSHFIFFAAVAAIVINKYTALEDVTIGTAFAGREHVQLKSALGVFINVLPLRIRIDAENDFASFLAEVKQACLECYDHRQYPFELVVEGLAAGQDMARNPVFDILLLVHDFGDAAYQQRLKQAGAQAMPWRLPVSKYDCTINVFILEGEITIEIEYSTSLFEKQRIESLLDHLLVVVETVCSGYRNSIRRLSILRSDEKKRLLHELNATALPLPEQTTILSLIEAQAKNNAGKAAIHDETLDLSYGDVWRYAEKLALLFKEQFQLGPGDNAVVHLERSGLVPLVYLGILLTGAAFVPVAAGFPYERVQLIIRDVQAKVVVTDLDITFPGIPLYRLPHLRQWDLIRAEMLTRREPDPDSIAYIIYTSGSTGLPKGVAVTHRNLLNFALAFARALQLKENVHLLAVTSLSFDISLLEMLWTLSQGMEITIATTLIGLNRYAGAGINTLQITPSLLRMLLADEGSFRFLAVMEQVLIGGEPLTEALVNELRSHSSARIYNAYGPTETTIWSTIKLLSAGEKITAGTPISNTSIYVLDEDMNLVPAGLMGQIYIGGKGVAKEYLGRKELTEQRFIDDPFLLWQEGKMYATGDLGCWDFSGELQIAGRMDRQIKINGFRIEPGEIEQMLRETGLVQQAAVSVINVGDDHMLAAWLIPAQSFDVRADLIPLLNKKLPAYMIPAQFFRVMHFPVTHSGKLDWTELKKNGKLAAATPPGAYKKPVTEVQQQLADMLRKMLGRDLVGIDENFFEMGGNSIKAVRFLANVRNIFSVNIDAGIFFREPTIEFASAEIENHRLLNSLQKNNNPDGHTYNFTI